MLTLQAPVPFAAIAMPPASGSGLLSVPLAVTKRALPLPAGWKTSTSVPSTPAAEQPVSEARPETSSRTRATVSRRTVVAGLDVSTQAFARPVSGAADGAGADGGTSTIGPGATDGGPSGFGTIAGTSTTPAPAGLLGAAACGVSWNITSASWIEPSAGVPNPSSTAVTFVRSTPANAVSG